MACITVGGGDEVSITTGKGNTGGDLPSDRLNSEPPNDAVRVFGCPGSGRGILGNHGCAFEKKPVLNLC